MFKIDESIDHHINVRLSLAACRTVKKIPSTLCAIVISVVSLIGAWLFMLPKMSKDSYAMTYFDKQILLQTRTAPRIIFVGGSNVAFSIDSALVKQTCKRNVINNGTQLGFGLSFMLDSMKKYLLPGDLIVICPEYELFFGLHYGDEALVYLASVDPSILSNIRLEQMSTLLLSARSVLKRNYCGLLSKIIRRIVCIGELKQPSKFKWRRNDLNENGDIRQLLTKQQQDPSPAQFPQYINSNSQYNPVAIKIINEFAKSVARNHIKVVFVLPYICKTFYASCAPAIENLNAVLKANLQIPIIDNQDYVMPDEYFYDSRYHPLTYYKKMRTSNLIPELSHYLSN